MLLRSLEEHVALNEPIARPEEISRFLRRLPIAVDRDQFLRLMSGFPRRYLELTPAADVVRHYALIRSLGARAVVSSLFRRGEGWRISVVARDRSSLFARIAGSLSCFGLSITGAEAFANESAVVLDSFDCDDSCGTLEAPGGARRFQVFLEGVVSGAQDVEPLLEGRLPGLKLAAGTPISVEWEDESHPSATRLLLKAPDRFGLLYLVSRSLSLVGCNIEMADVATPAGRALDSFYLTRGGERLSARDRVAIERALLALVEPRVA